MDLIDDVQYAVIVDSPDPQEFRIEVTRLLYEAGLMNSVSVMSLSKGSSPQI